MQNIEPMFLGQGEEALYAVLHPSREQRTGGPALLLVSPTGEDAIRVHRFYRRLAEDIAEQGVTCLRYDHHGTGESAGEGLSPSIERWADDLWHVNEELKVISGVTKIIWLGVGLGATIVLQALTNGDAGRTKPAGLVLVSPVLDGAAYEKTLLAGHQHTAFKPAPSGEALGFLLPEFLFKEINGVAASACQSISWPRRVDTFGLANEDVRHAIDQGARRPSHAPAFTDTAWDSDQGLNALSVPADALKVLTELVASW